MEIDENDSETEDMFSDEDCTEKVNVSSPVALDDANNKSFLDNSILFSQDQANLQTPGKAMIPKTPLSLVPFMTKGDNGWTSDLETPVSDKLSKMAQVNEVNNGNKNVDGDGDDTSQEFTPRNTPLTAGQDEFVPASPVVSSRKPKRHAKRRIFNRDLTNNSTIVSSGDNSNKENISRRVKSDEVLGNLNNKNESTESDCLVEKYIKLRELSKKLNRASERDITIGNNNETITDDVFVNNIKALETADREHCKIYKRQAPFNVPSKPQGYVSISEACINDNVETSFINNEVYSGFSDLILSPWKTGQSQDTDDDNVVEFINNDFRGFSKEDQRASKSLLSKYSRIFQIEDKSSQDNDEVLSTDYDTLSSRRIDVFSQDVGAVLSPDVDDGFKGFSSAERENSLEKAEKLRLYYEKLVEETPDEANNANRIILEPSPINEQRFLSSIVVMVKTGYKNCHTSDEITLDMKKINEAWERMTREKNIDLLLVNNNQLNIETIEKNSQSSSVLDDNELVDDTIEIDSIDLMQIEKDDGLVKGNLIKSEFKTAGGTVLYLTKIAEERAKLFFENDDESIEDDSRLNFAGIARVFTQLVQVHSEAENKTDKVTIVADKSDDKADVEMLVISNLNDKADMQSTNTCGTVANTLDNLLKKKSRLSSGRRSIVKFIEPETTPTIDLKINKTPIATKTPTTTPPPPLGGFNTSGFSSSKEKPMSISKNALLRAQAIFNEEAGPSIERETTPKMNNDLSSKNIIAGGSGGFTFGKGQPAVISNKLLMQARVKFESDFNEPGSTGDTTPQQNVNITPKLSTSCGGGFATATGKSCSISKNTLLKVKANFGEDFDELTTAEITPDFSRASKSNFNDQDLDGNLNDFDADCLEEMKNLKKKIESRSGAGVQVKRPNPSDDITPFGRKRSRWATELQARKLFDDADQDADNQPSTSSNNFHIEKNNKERKLNKTPVNFEATFVGEISSNISDDSEELRSATEDFLQDIQNSPSNSMTKYCSRITKQPSLLLNNNNTSDNSRDNKRPLSLPSKASNSQDNNSTNKKSLQRSLSPNYHESIPDDLYFDTQFSDDEQSAKDYLNKIDINKLSSAIENQKNIINIKKINREKPIMGSYLKLKRDKNTKLIKLENLCDRGSVLPSVRSQSQFVAYKIDPNVASIDSVSATSYQFNLSEFYPKNRDNPSIGIILNDSVHIIPKENNFAGVEEFERSFLASPGVDPTLLPRGWFENHYKWIVWKLATMDRYNFKNLPRSLTPQSLMSQLKYRYDREIDCSERPAIRRIMEKDSVVSRRIVLCVSRILPTARVSDCNSRISELELTDGWYSIRTTIDSPLNYYVNNNKIKVGTKLMIHGAQLVNLEEGCYPLEASSDVRLKISTNSTRRVKWFIKMGFQRQSGPIKLSLKNINPNGGLIGKIVVAVARIYPLLFKEKTDDGKIILRNARCEEKAANEFQKVCQAKAEAIYESKNNDENYKIMNNIKPRDVSPCLKILITDGITSGIVTIWSNAEECSQIFKETSCIGIYNSQASGMRSSELQLTANRWTKFYQYNKNLLNINCTARCFTRISSMSIGFSPVYSEFDTIGVVVSIGSAPPGMKCFETMNLAYRNEDNIDSFMSILFWQGISEYGYTDIANIGSVVICKNLQWRKNTPQSCIPLAFCTEKTIISRNSRQNPHLHDEFESLNKRIDDIKLFVRNSADKIHEITKKTSGLISVSTPTSNKSRDSRIIIDTPEDETRTSRTSNKARIERLKNYGAASSLSPISIGTSPRVSLGYRPPIIKNTNKNIPTTATTSHKKL